MLKRVLIGGRATAAVVRGKVHTSGENKELMGRLNKVDSTQEFSTKFEAVARSRQQKTPVDGADGWRLKPETLAFMRRWV